MVNNMKKINFKELIISIFIPLTLAGLVSLLLNFNIYQKLNKPPLSPPKIVFPIAWTIIYILMGISSYKIYISKNLNKNDALKNYILQLIINLLWSIIFFGLKKYLFALIWIILLILLVLKMIKKYFYIEKIAAYLQIPYILWLLFATYLNFGIYLLN